MVQMEDSEFFVDADEEAVSVGKITTQHNDDMEVTQLQAPMKLEQSDPITLNVNVNNCCTRNCRYYCLRGGADIDINTQSNWIRSFKFHRSLQLVNFHIIIMLRSNLTNRHRFLINIRKVFIIFHLHSHSFPRAD